MAKDDKKASTEVTESKTGQAPAFLSEQKMTGEGFSKDASDRLIPMAVILQKMSPQVDEAMTGSYVKGAKPGMFYLKNSAIPLYDSFLFQPCYFHKGVVEWVPRGSGGGAGGGFVAFHKDMPKDAKSAPDPNNKEKTVLMNPKGNIYVETRYHTGFMIDPQTMRATPLVLPFTSTGHTVSKKFQDLMDLQQFNGGPVDAWACYYRVDTVLKQKGQNNWYIAEITNAGSPDDREQPTTMWAPTVEDYNRGKQLHSDLKAGNVNVDVAGASNDDAHSSDVGDHSSNSKM
jgi:hypothetical protein